jgi:hypothetical protein
VAAELGRVVDRLYRAGRLVAGGLRLHRRNSILVSLKRKNGRSRRFLKLQLPLLRFRQRRRSLPGQDCRDGENSQHEAPAGGVLEWNCTELMCLRGHGLLYVPESPTSWFRAQRWFYLER